MTTRTSAASRFSRRDAMRLLGRAAALGLVGGLPAPARVNLMARALQGPFESAGTVTFPEGAIIRLLLTDERPERLGNGALLWHEHPAMSPYASPPNAQMSDEAQLSLMVDEIKAAQAEGLGCIFDAATLSTRRRSDEKMAYLRALATRSGVPLGIAGGYHSERSYPTDAAAMSEAQFVEEIVEDAARQRWGALGEIGTSLPTTDLERKYLRAVGQAQRRTNLAIFTHVPNEGCPSCAVEQLDIFESQGVDPSRVCIGHIGDFHPHQDPGWETHKQLARRGAWLGFDSVGAPLEIPGIEETTAAQKVQMVLSLLDAGFEDQLLFSSDFYRPENLKANYGAGLSAVMTVFVPKLRYAGVPEATVVKMLVDNPRRFFAFVPPA